jgi:hypothetical protein
MTNREANIVSAILDVAHDSEGGQFTETVLHTVAGVRLQTRGQITPTLGEFNAALAIIAQRGWMTAITSTVTGKRKWSINDAGEAARLEM